MNSCPREQAPQWQQAAYRVIFESDTPAGRAADIMPLALRQTAVPCRDGA